MFMLWLIAGSIVGLLAPRLPDVLVRFTHTENPVERHPQVYLWLVWIAPVVSAGYAAMMQSVTGLMIYTLLLIVTLVDVKYHLIPDVLTIPSIGILLFIAIWRESTVAFLIGGGFALVTFIGPYLLRPGGLGGGDVKLAVVIGLLLGFPSLVWALLIGATTGAAMLLGLRLRGAVGPGAMIPYGPFLCLGALMLLPV
jgi:prepilin signal peptidase PulO-like enzyme (type II secretory pathway)